MNMKPVTTKSSRQVCDSKGRILYKLEDIPLLNLFSFPVKLFDFIIK
jgi:hypothetical protein